MPQLNQRERIDGPPIYRSVEVDASVVDRENRTIRLSFSSEDALVARYSWWDEPWLERLGHEESEVDLSFLNSGNAPSLWNHDSWQRENTVGVVEKAWIEGKRGHAIVRLSKRAGVEDLLTDIEDGIVKNVSVGYQLLERVLVKLNADGKHEWRVSSWKPHEISFVPLPADEGVGVGRSDDATHRRYTVTTIEERAMPTPVQTQPAPPATEQRQAEPAGGNITPPPAPAVPPAISAPPTDASEQQRAAGAAAERARVMAIRGFVRDHALDADFERNAIDQGHSLDQVRNAVLDQLIARQVDHRPRMTPGQDEADKTRDAAVNWLLRKGGHKVDEKDLQGNPFIGARLEDVARQRLEARGFRTSGLYGDSLARAAVSHSTSDFPVLMENVMHKSMRAEFTLASDTWRLFCVVGSVPDFRPSNSYASGGIGDLQDVGEDGLLKHGKLRDGEREQVSVKSKGLIITLSRQMIVNDDLGTFLQVSRKLGRSSARTIEKLAYAVLLANPVLKSDGKAIFHADHGNLNTGGAAPSTAGFDAARMAMSKQKDVGADDFLDLRPALWLGPVEHGGQARVVNSNEWDVDSTKFQIQNKVRNMLKSIVDSPRLTGNQWYLFADPNEEPVLQVSFLNGQQEPQTEMEETFEALGIRWRVYHDFGVDPVGYRGAQKVTW